MRQARASAPESASDDFFLPDFCQPKSVLAVVLVAEHGEEGAMGLVLRAYHASLKTQWAIKVLRPELENKSRFFQGFNRGFRRITDGYETGVAWMIRRGAVGVLLFAVMVMAAAGLWRITPGSLVPDEDQGFYIAAVVLPDGATLERTDRVVGEVVKAIRTNPVNEDVVAFTGFDLLGGGFELFALMTAGMATIAGTMTIHDDLERRLAGFRLFGPRVFGRRAWALPNVMTTVRAGFSSVT